MVMAEWKISHWEERYDVYNDEPFWIHRTTGAVRTDRPRLEEFVPEGYQVKDVGCVELLQFCPLRQRVER